MKTLTILLITLMSNIHSTAEEKPTIQEVKLWTNHVPGFPPEYQHKPFTQQDPERITETSQPIMRIFPAKAKPTGQAIVILPGGGYRILAHKKEGDKVAEYFAAKGITCFVAHYRVTKGNNPAYQYPGPLLDARQAIKLAKASAKTYGFEPDKVGIMGFSAGGHLASMCATLYNKKLPHEADSKFTPKPAFVALIYPVASMIDPKSHKGSKKSLLGKNPTRELLQLTSPELNVQKNPPPLFIAHNRGDHVDSKLSETLAAAWKKSGAKTELNIFEGNQHGFGMGAPGQTKETHPATIWPKLLETFLTNKLNLNH